MVIEHLIAKVGTRLTPTERRIAETVIADPTLLAFGSVSDLAERVGTSRPSIVRFATKLGFSGYPDLQSHAREGVSEQLSRPTERIRSHQRDAIPVRTDIADALEHVFEALPAEKAASLAAPIAGARHVWVLSGETSRAGAYALQSGLSMVRPAVQIVSEHAVGRELSSATPEDAAVVFDFARYRRHAITATRTLAAMGVPIIAITDGPLSPLATLTPHWCALRIPAVGPFDSSVPAVAAAELLVAAVVEKLGDTARDRLDRLEHLWQTTGTFFSE